MLDDGSGALERCSPQIGSNAYGFGREATENGRGLVLGNPHFPWDGSERLYQAHLHDPRQDRRRRRLALRRAADPDRPHPRPRLVAHRRHRLALHPVQAHARARRPALVRRRRRDEGRWRRPRSRSRRCRRRRARDVTRTIYSTEYGPMINDLVGHPAAVERRHRLRARRRQRDQLPLPQPLPRRTTAPRSVARVRPRSSAATRASRGSTRSRPTRRATPTTRCRARSRTCTDEHAAECNVGQPGFEMLGLPILDGSRSACNWAARATRRSRPAPSRPTRSRRSFRDDYVHNGNDSHWLSNPEEPLTGFDRIIGIEEAERTLPHAARPDPGRGAPRRHRRPARQPVQPQLAPAGRARQPPVPRRAVARRPGHALRGGARRLPARLGRPGRRLAAPASRWRLEPARRPRLERRDPLPALRLAASSTTSSALPTGLQGATCPGCETLFTTPSSRPPTRSTRPAAASTSRTRSSARARRRGHRPARAPASRSTRRCAGVQYETRGGEDDPDPRRPRRPRRLQRDHAPWQPDEGGYPDVQHGSSFIMAARVHRREVPRAGRHLRHLRPDREPGLPARQRLHEGVLGEEVARRPFCAEDVAREALESYEINIGGP